MLYQIQEWLDDLAAIANEKRRVAKADERKFIWYSTQKNKDIKRKFSIEGEKLSSNGSRFSSRSSGDSSGREWLYDFALREFDESNHLLGIKLAVEIELSDSKVGGLIYDFNKLLQSDSSYKCFIFQKKDEAAFTEILGGLNNLLNKYHHRVDSQFIVACWITSKYKFIYQQFIVDGNQITRK